MGNKIHKQASKLDDNKVKSESKDFIKESIKQDLNKQLSVENFDNFMKNSSSMDLVDKIWQNIDSEFYSDKPKQIHYEEEIIEINKLTKQKAHKAIRIFVSSTFTDFFNEREMLVKQVG